MKNINTKDYWEKRFRTKNWGKSGNRQTREYAKANVAQMDLNSDYDGKILDFGCALGDAIPIYKTSFPQAKLYGIDFSEEAIQICKEAYGDIAEFSSGNHQKVNKQEVVIASHVMEHITDDKQIVKQILSQCKALYVFVPFKENPLYREHVNYYEEDYYADLNVEQKKIFLVHFNYRYAPIEAVKSFLKGKFTLTGSFKKEIIMYKIKGSIS